MLKPERARGVGDLFEGRTVLGQVEYDVLVTYAGDRDARPPEAAIEGKLKPRGWSASHVPSTGMVLTLSDTRTFGVERIGGYNRLTRSCKIRGNAVALSGI